MCPAPLVCCGGCVACVVSLCLSVVSAVGSRPVPFRTRKLSLPAPMVLHLGGCGRVGHCRHHSFVVEGVWVRGLVDCPVWMVGRFLCLCTLFLCVVFTHNSPHRGGSRVVARHRGYRGPTRDPKPGGTGVPAPSPVRGRPGPGDGRVSAFRHGCVTVSSQGFPWMTGVHGDYQLP